jgi:cytochrome c peroxidase
MPVVPISNPMSEAKVELGRHLFFDRRLSGNSSQSCESCHHQERAFSDGVVSAEGSTGESLPRNSMALVNVAYNAALTWANPSLKTIEEQLLVPLFAEHPVELGLTGREEEVLNRLRAEPRYHLLFSEAFPDQLDPFSIQSVVAALASYVRALISADSPFDRFTYRQEAALSQEALRGMELFYSERLECHHCHGGFNFSSSTSHSALESDQGPHFHNTGLYNLDEEGAYPKLNQGLYAITGELSDMGRFRAPTLRNIELTAPYMHDGSIETLEEVIRHYEAGGRTIEGGDYAGQGELNPYKSAFVTGFQLSDRERMDLIAFLKSLTDESFVTDPQLSDPWE